MRLHGAMLLGMAALAACYEPPSRCGIACTTDCPPGFTCQNKLCVPNDGSTCELPQIEFTTIDTGSSHTCGLDTSGKLYCWGNNGRSQLGLAGVSRTAIPTQIGEPGWGAVTVGSEHTCALRDGLPWCWGQDRNGQASGASGSVIPLPAKVAFGPSPAPPAAFDQLVAGGRGTCTIGAGELWCWGNGSAVGNNGVDTIKPVRIGSASDWRSVSMGWDHGCGISDSAGLMCWGGNNRGQTGQPTSATSVPVPTAVTLPGGLRALKVATGDEMTCVIASASSADVPGELWCWGRNDNFQIDDTRMSTAIPTRVGLENSWTAMAVGIRNVCGVLGGTAYCWGTDYDGVLGAGYWRPGETAFVDAKPLGPADSIALSIGQIDSGVQDGFGCLTVGTTASCWGNNSYGELGLGMFSLQFEPVEVPAPSGTTWSHLWAGDEHVCATTMADNTLYCWGADYNGEVTAGAGLGGDSACRLDLPCDHARPISAPSGIGSVDEIAIGNGYTCARDEANIHCWGSNNSGNLGVNNAQGHAVTTVNPPPTAGSWIGLTGGKEGTCGFTDTAAVACWGVVAGVWQNVPTTQTSTELHDITELRFEYEYGCGVRSSDNTRICWGRNDNNQLGDDSTTNRSSPTPITVGGPVTALAVDYFHGCALTLAGGVACWGSNDRDEAGQTTGNPIPHPMPVSSSMGPLTGCTAVAVTWATSCAICGGQVMCWGYNYTGELGIGTRTNSTPIAATISAPPTRTFVELGMRESGGCALDADGKIWCWGYGPHGDNGDGGRDRNLPTPVGSTPL